jgi:choline-glycine betaine transporter
MVEARGRTGRKPTAAEKDPQVREKERARRARGDRYDRPPTWLSAFYRAMVAAVLMLLVSLLLIKQKADAIAVFPLVLALYVPISYYTDLWMYRRRMRKKEQERRAEQARRSEQRRAEEAHKKAAAG